MPPTQSPASNERCAAAIRLQRLFLAGLLPRRALERSLARLQLSRRWVWWSKLMLLILGSALMLAGAIFLIAYNWVEMDKMAKLGGLQLLLLGCVGGAWHRGLDRIDGQVLLFLACVLVGVLLAAFGQVYQTGADAWELFRAWAALIVIWVVASRSAVHWLLLVVIVDAWVTMYYDQVWFLRWERESWAWLSLAAIQAVALLGTELGQKTGYLTTARPWPRWILVPTVLFLLCAPATMILIDDRYDQPASWLVGISYLGVVCGGYPYLRHRVRDLFCLTCLGFSLAWMIMVLALRVLDIFHRDSCGGLLFVGLLVIGMLTALVRWVRRLSATMGREAADA